MKRVPAGRGAPRRTSCIAAVAAALSAACVAGAPLGFPDGTNWAVPLLGALEDGPMVTPVRINGQGPYLFYLNPHAVSIIDPRLARTLGLYVYRTNRGITDQTDRVVHEQIDLADADTVSLGNLTVRRRTFVVLSNDATYNGWPISGTLGGDFIDDTLIWTIDRDRQMLYLATQGHQRPPPAAVRIAADRIEGNRFFIDVELDGRDTYLFADIAYPRSELWPAVANETRLPAMSRYAFDHFRQRRRYDGCWSARSVQVGPARADDVVFYPYEDKRVRARDLDGRLGRDFFARFHVTVNWHEKSIWVAPRAPDLDTHRRDRLTRWGERFAACKTPACVTLTKRDGSSGPELVIGRDAAMVGTHYEVLLEARDRAGKPLPLPRLTATFPEWATYVVVGGPGGVVYGNAPGIEVIDATPFVADCDAPDPTVGCVTVTTSAAR